MLEFCVNKQVIKRTDINTIVSNSTDYLTAEFNFSNDWKGLTKTAFFTSTTTSIGIILDSDNKITEDKHLNLATGTWVVSVKGVLDDRKIITNIMSFVVVESGASNGTSPPDPTPDVYDQILTQLALIDYKIDDVNVSDTTTFSSEKIVTDYQRKDYNVKLFGTKNTEVTVNLTDSEPIVSATNYIETAAATNVVIDFVNGSNIAFNRTSVSPIKLNKDSVVEFNLYVAYARTCSVEYGAIMYADGVAISNPFTFGNQDFTGDSGFNLTQVLKYIVQPDLLASETIYPAGTVFTTKLFKRQESASPTLTTRYLFGLSKNSIDRFSYAKIKTNI